MVKTGSEVTFSKLVADAAVSRQFRNRLGSREAATAIKTARNEH
jgi:hypothetical protein